MADDNELKLHKIGAISQRETGNVWGADGSSAWAPTMGSNTGYTTKYNVKPSGEVIGKTTKDTVDTESVYQPVQTASASDKEDVKTGRTLLGKLAYTTKMSAGIGDEEELLKAGYSQEYLNSIKNDGGLQRAAEEAATIGDSLGAGVAGFFENTIAKRPLQRKAVKAAKQAQVYSGELTLDEEAQYRSAGMPEEQIEQIRQSRKAQYEKDKETNDAKAQELINKSNEYAKQAQQAQLFKAEAGGADAYLRELIDETRSDMAALKGTANYEADDLWIEKVSKAADANGKYLASELVYSLGQQLPTMAIGGVAGKALSALGSSIAAGSALVTSAEAAQIGGNVGNWVGLAAMGRNVYASSFDEQYANGASVIDASRKATLDTVVELSSEILVGGTPGLPGGYLDKAIDGVSNAIINSTFFAHPELFLNTVQAGNKVNATLMKYAQSAAIGAATFAKVMVSPEMEPIRDIIGEGFEEVYSEILTPILDRNLLRLDTADPTSGEIAYAFASGALTAGLFKMIGASANNALTSKANTIQNRVWAQNQNAVLEESRAQRAEARAQKASLKKATKYEVNANGIVVESTSETAKQTQTDQLTPTQQTTQSTTQETKPTTQPTKTQYTPQTEQAKAEVQKAQEVVATNPALSDAQKNTLGMVTLIRALLFDGITPSKDNTLEIAGTKVTLDFKLPIEAWPSDMIEWTPSLTTEQVASWIDNTLVPTITTYAEQQAQYKANPANKHSLDELSNRKYGVAYNDLSDEQKQIVQKVYANPANVKPMADTYTPAKVNPEQKKAIDSVGKYLSKVGMKVMPMTVEQQKASPRKVAVVDSKGIVRVNPRYSGSRVVMAVAVAHEIVHQAQLMGSLNVLNANVKSLITSLGMDIQDWFDAVKKMPEYSNYTPDQINAEVCARFLGYALGSDHLLGQIAAIDTSTLQGMSDFIDSTVDPTATDKFTRNMRSTQATIKSLLDGTYSTRLAEKQLQLKQMNKQQVEQKATKPSDGQTPVRSEEFSIETGDAELDRFNYILDSNQCQLHLVEKEGETYNWNKKKSPTYNAVKNAGFETVVVGQDSNGNKIYDHVMKDPAKVQEYLAKYNVDLSAIVPDTMANITAQSEATIQQQTQQREIPRTYQRTQEFTIKVDASSPYAPLNGWRAYYNYTFRQMTLIKPVGVNAITPEQKAALTALGAQFGGTHNARDAKTGKILKGLDNKPLKSGSFKTRVLRGSKALQAWSALDLPNVMSAEVYEKAETREVSGKNNVMLTPKQRYLLRYVNQVVQNLWDEKTDIPFGNALGIKNNNAVVINTVSRIPKVMLGFEGHVNNDGRAYQIIELRTADGKALQGKAHDNAVLLGFGWGHKTKNGYSYFKVGDYNFYEAAKRGNVEFFKSAEAKNDAPVTVARHDSNIGETISDTGKHTKMYDLAFLPYEDADTLLNLDGIPDPTALGMMVLIPSEELTHYKNKDLAKTAKGIAYSRGWRTATDHAPRNIPSGWMWQAYTPNDWANAGGPTMTAEELVNEYRNNLVKEANSEILNEIFASKLWKDSKREVLIKPTANSELAYPGYLLSSGRLVYLEGDEVETGAMYYTTKSETSESGSTSTKDVWVPYDATTAKNTPVTTQFVDESNDTISIFYEGVANPVTVSKDQYNTYAEDLGVNKIVDNVTGEELPILRTTGNSLASEKDGNTYTTLDDIRVVYDAGDGKEAVTSLGYAALQDYTIADGVYKNGKPKIDWDPSVLRIYNSKTGAVIYDKSNPKTKSNILDSWRGKLLVHFRDGTTIPYLAGTLGDYATAMDSQGHVGFGTRFVESITYGDRTIYSAKNGWAGDISVDEATLMKEPTKKQTGNAKITGDIQSFYDSFEKDMNFRGYVLDAYRKANGLDRRTKDATIEKRVREMFKSTTEAMDRAELIRVVTEAYRQEALGLARSIALDLGYRPDYNSIENKNISNFTLDVGDDLSDALVSAPVVDSGELSAEDFTIDLNHPSTAEVLSTSKYIENSEAEELYAGQTATDIVNDLFKSKLEPSTDTNNLSGMSDDTDVFIPRYEELGTPLDDGEGYAASESMYDNPEYLDYILSEEGYGSISEEAAKRRANAIEAEEWRREIKEATQNSNMRYSAMYEVDCSEAPALNNYGLKVRYNYGNRTIELIATRSVSITDPSAQKFLNDKGFKKNPNGIGFFAKAEDSRWRSLCKVSLNFAYNETAFAADTELVDAIKKFKDGGLLMRIRRPNSSGSYECVNLSASDIFKGNKKFTLKDLKKQYSDYLNRGQFVGFVSPTEDAISYTLTEEELKAINDKLGLNKAAMTERKIDELRRKIRKIKREATKKGNIAKAKEAQKQLDQVELLAKKRDTEAKARVEKEGEKFRAEVSAKSKADKQRRAPYIAEANQLRERLNANKTQVKELDTNIEGIKSNIRPIERQIAKLQKEIRDRKAALAVKKKITDPVKISELSDVTIDGLNKEIALKRTQIAELDAQIVSLQSRIDTINADTVAASKRSQQLDRELTNSDNSTAKKAKRLKADKIVANAGTVESTNNADAVYYKAVEDYKRAYAEQGSSKPGATENTNIEFGITDIEGNIVNPEIEMRVTNNLGGRDYRTGALYVYEVANTDNGVVLNKASLKTSDADKVYADTERPIIVDGPLATELYPGDGSTIIKAVAKYLGSTPKKVLSAISKSNSAAYAKATFSQSTIDSYRQRNGIDQSVSDEEIAAKLNDLMRSTSAQLDSANTLERVLTAKAVNVEDIMGGVTANGETVSLAVVLAELADVFNPADKQTFIYDMALRLGYDGIQYEDRIILFNTDQIIKPSQFAEDSSSQFEMAFAMQDDDYSLIDSLFAEEEASMQNFAEEDSYIPEEAYQEAARMSAEHTEPVTVTQAANTRLNNTVHRVIKDHIPTKEFADNFERLISSSQFGQFEVLKDKTARAYARSKIAGMSVADAFANWSNDYEYDRVSGEKGLVWSVELLNALGAAYTQAKEAGEDTTGYLAASEKVLVGISELTHESGQVLRAAGRFIQTAMSSNEAALYYAKRWIERMNKSLGTDLKLSNDLITLIEDAKTPEEIDDALASVGRAVALQANKGKKNIRRWLDEFRSVMMLSAPVTHVRNIASNVVNSVNVICKGLIGGTIEDIFAPKLSKRHVSIKNSMKATADPKIAANWNAMNQFALQLWKSPYIQQTVAEYGSKYSSKTRKGQAYNSMENAFNDVYTPFNTQLMADVSKAVFNALEYEDVEGVFGFGGLKWHFLHAFKQMARSNGWTTEYLMDQRNQYELNEAIEYASTEAKKATYHLESGFVNKLNQLKHYNLITEILIGAVMPFTKTPVNVAKSALQYSPLSFLKAIEEGVDVAVKGEDSQYSLNSVIDRVASGMTGLNLVLVGMALAAMGKLKASGTGDDKQDYYDKNQGEQEYSLIFDGLGSYTLDWAAPPAIALFAGVEAAQYLARMGETGDVDLTVADAINAFGEASVSLLNPLVDMSFMQGLNNVLESLSYGDGLMSVPGVIASNYASQFVPNILSRARNVIDPTVRSTYAPSDSRWIGGASGERTVRKIHNKIPGASEYNAPSVDYWGNEKSNSTGSIIGDLAYQMLSPGYWSSDKSTQQSKYVEELSARLNDTSILPTAPAKYFTIDGRKYILDNEEYSKVSKVQGNTLSAGLLDMSNSDLTASISDEVQGKAVSLLKTYSANVAHDDYMYLNDIEYDNSNKKEIAKVQEAVDTGLSVGEYFLIKAYLNSLDDKSAKKNYALSIGLSSTQKKLFNL